MSAPSPVPAAAADFSFKIKVDGTEIDSAIQVISIDAWTAVNRIPRAEILLFDGGAAEEDFRVSDSATFLPGGKLEVLAGYQGNLQSLWKGVIVRNSIQISRNSGSTLTVEAADEAISMTVARTSSVFEKIKDGDLIGKLIDAHGLAKDVATTTTDHENVVQYYASDWDMMVARAEINGFVVTVSAGKVTVQAPDTGQSPVLCVTYGESILELQAELDSVTQYSSSAIKSFTWDIAKQQLIDAGPGSVRVTEAGNVSSAKLAEVCKATQLYQQTGALVEQESLQTWSSARLLWSKLAKIRGQVRFVGSPLAQVGKTIQLAGVGERFNGNLFIGGVHHNIAQNRWLTRVDFGLEDRSAKPGAAGGRGPAAAGQLPAIHGLQTGIVKQMAVDPAGEFRILVTMPLAHGAGNGVWARLGTFYASNKFGALFYPEIGDEVIVAFMNEDPRFPVIMGSVNSSKLAPPFTLDDKNNMKALVTRTKMQITFNELDKIIQIETPGKHIVTMDDKEATVTIKDSNKNSITLSSSGIAMDSPANISITAKGNITIKAGGNLAMSATANATLDALQIAMTAKTSLKAEGSATAELASSALVNIHGALVKIN